MFFVKVHADFLTSVTEVMICAQAEEYLGEQFTEPAEQQAKYIYNNIRRMLEHFG